MDPHVGNRGTVGFKDKSIGIVPDSDSIFSKMGDHFLRTIGIESLYFRCLIYLYISY